MDIFWTSYVHSIYVLCLRGQIFWIFQTICFFYLLKNQSDLNAKNIFDCGIVEQFSRQITYVVNSSEIFM